MRRLTVFACAVAATIAAKPALAQSVPEKMPFDIPYGMPISYADASKLIDAAAAEAKKHDWKMNIAVVDPNGDLIAFQRMDGAQIASVAISQGKARTAARYRRATEVFFKAFESGHPYLATLDPTLVASPGGIPLVRDGKLIGAIGCSGGTGDQDAVVCKAGADSLK